MNQDGFALQIFDTPALGARQGSNDELATLGLDRRLCLADGFLDQGEAVFRIRFFQDRNVSRRKTLYNSGILMEDRNEDAKAPEF
jgi:hypothetical protein